MSAFYFGDSSKPLFGYYSPANPARDRHKAVLICPGSFQDYMRSHRPLKQLATNLSRQGIHVLRFDYPGCGDSSGSWEDRTINDWVKSIEVAAAELQAISMVDNLYFLGVRLGASLLNEADLKSFSATKFIWWDPVLSGQAYINAMQENQKALIADLDRFAFHRRDYFESHDLEMVGYPITTLSLKQLAQLDMSAKPVMAQHVFILHSHLQNEYQYYAQEHQAVQLRTLLLPCYWESLDHIELQILVPELTNIINDIIKK